MFASTSIEIVKLVGCRRISHLIPRSTVQDYFPLYTKKSKSQLLRCKSQQYLVALKWFTVLEVSKLQAVSKPGIGILTSLQEICLVPHSNYQTKSNDFNKEEDDHCETENKAKNVLDDLEFQSILKDFAQDFGMNEESNKFLEEMKKQQHSPETEQSPSKTCTDDHERDFKSDEQRTSRCSLSEHKLEEFHSSPAPNVEETEDHSADDDFFHIDQELEKPVEYDAKRGKGGVYDIDELVNVLKEENLLDISVVQIPKSFHYADYLVLATAKSRRHCHAVMEFVIKFYKKKKNKEDPFVKYEGRGPSPWKALDLGNIILHVFLEDTRNYYDIESLWLLDQKYDDAGSVKSDPQLDMMQQHLDFLNSLNSQ